MSEPAETVLDQLESQRALRREYRDAIKALEAAELEPNSEEHKDLVQLAHEKFVDLTNWYETTIAWARFERYWSDPEWLKFMAETCTNVLRQVVLKYYPKHRAALQRLGLPEDRYAPSPKMFATMQRMVAKFDPERVKDLQPEFEGLKLPTAGFESPNELPGLKAISCYQLLTQMEIKSTRGVFVLGCFDRRVTIYSQQVRALNLIYSLFEEKRIDSNSNVAVIGGGFAGLTAAASAAAVGCSVTVLEKQKPLHVFQGCQTRWLHPRIYDWPEEGSESQNAGLPLLNWTAGYACDVYTQVIEAFEKLGFRDKIKVCSQLINIDFGTGLDLSWHSASGPDSDSFDVIIVAVGFGAEKVVEGIPWLGYWDTDNLHQSSQQGNKTHLVSGTGDGGLIDVLRVRLDDFRYEKILSEVLVDLPKTTRQALLRIEAEAKRHSNPGKYLNEEYRNLTVPQSVDDNLMAMVRPDTTVVLNGREPYPFSLNTCILNRFLLSRLYFRNANIQYRKGEISCCPKDGKYEVTFNPSSKIVFDRVTCRHGPSPSALAAGFSELFNASSERMGVYAELDQTRAPIYGDFFASRI